MTKRTTRRRRQHLRVGLALGLCLGLVGCDDQGLEEEEVQYTHQQGIQGGQTDNGTYSSVIGMFTFKGNSGGICSGTLIAPNLVLTAQHCIADSNTGGGVRCGVTRFTDTALARNVRVTTDNRLSRNGQLFVGSEIHVPEGTREFCGQDVALIILQNNIPESVTIPIEPRLDIPPTPGEVYTAVGFGHTGNGQDSGTRRFITGRTVLCGGNRPCNSFSTTASEFTGSRGTCQGDSGGAPLDSKGRVFGALSRGPGTCGNGTYAGIYEWRDWIRDIARRAAAKGKYAAPAWAQGGPVTDNDFDEIPNDVDNCIDIANPDQANLDGDGFGDACDDDIDGDNVKDERDDNCPDVKNDDQLDTDNDGFGDACDEDDDGDIVKDEKDNCPLTPNELQKNADGDEFGDACDDDNDNDGVKDDGDNCPLKPNADQADVDGDGKGDACDSKDDRPEMKPDPVDNPISGFEPVNPGGGSESSSASAADDGGCSSTGGQGPAGDLGYLALLGLGLVGLRRRKQ